MNILKNITLYILLFPLFIISCRKADYQRNEGMIWNTLYHITYDSETDLQDSIISVLNNVGQSLSIFDENSLVSLVNSQNTTIVNNDFINVYNTSLKFNEASGGKFDPTVSPLITAWGFGPGHKATSDTTRIDSLLSFVGINRTILKDNLLIKSDKRIQFNFSAIAKGYGCDEIAAMFQRNGIKNYMIEIGGEITVAGLSPSGKEWTVSIDAPTDSNVGDNHDSFTIIQTTNCGIATSGNYRNFHESAQGRIGHTISPVTGRPATTDVLSATVIAPDCMTADAAATACMASGSDEAKKMINQLNLQALLILSDTIWMTPGFSSLIINPSK